jgi:hypothetical protein
MNRWLLTWVLSLLLVPLAVWPAAGPGREGRTLPTATPLPAETAPIEEAFRQAVQLWAKGQFDELWARGLLESRYQVSKEAFIRWMRQRAVTPHLLLGADPCGDGPSAEPRGRARGGHTRGRREDAGDHRGPDRALPSAAGGGRVAHRSGGLHAQAGVGWRACTRRG